MSLPIYFFVVPIFSATLGWDDSSFILWALTFILGFRKLFLSSVPGIRERFRVSSDERFSPADDCGDRLIQYCHDVGFFKEREISFPHKQASLMKIRRDAWVAPEL